jgi:hypothetical protein
VNADRHDAGTGELSMVSRGGLFADGDDAAAA